MYDFRVQGSTDSSPAVTADLLYRHYCSCACSSEDIASFKAIPGATRVGNYVEEYHVSQQQLDVVLLSHLYTMLKCVLL